jgi:hypothetical protein
MTAIAKGNKRWVSKVAKTSARAKPAKAKKAAKKKSAKSGCAEAREKSRRPTTSFH